MSDQMTTPPMPEILAALLHATARFGNWKELESCCGGENVVMGYRVRVPIAAGDRGLDRDLARCAAAR